MRHKMNFYAEHSWFEFTFSKPDCRPRLKSPKQRKEKRNADLSHEH